MRAQGLIPLGYSSSNDEEGPVELPNGKLVCGPHGLQICGRCCVDYKFGFEESSDAQDVSGHGEDERKRPSHNALTKGTGRIFPTKFIPPSTRLTPSELFIGKVHHMLVTR